MINIEGKIIKITRGEYLVLANNKKYKCKARGKLRQMNVTPIVGDNITMDIVSETEGYIINVKPRRNELQRPPISNIDIAFIITSAVQPNFSSKLLDKMISMVEINNITPIICFSKLDIANKKIKKEIKDYIKYYKSIGYKVITNKQTFKIKKIFKNKTAVLSGQSGVGKSTLLNNLNKKLDIETAPISKALGRGKHTTRHVELLPLFKGWVADTPGFSALEFNKIDKKQIRDSFIEFQNLNCKYKECMHLKEPGCKVKEGLIRNKIKQSRYDNYKKIMEE